MRTLVLLSGGVDSTALLWHLKAQGHDCQSLAIDYGQRHRRELTAARKLADLAGVRHRTLSLFLHEYLQPHPLGQGRAALPEGADQSTTVVPGRNLVLISAAAFVAASLRLEVVAVGCHGGDRETYYDCRREWLDTAARLLSTGLQLHAPFLGLSKVDVVARAKVLNVPLTECWSCYAGGKEPCHRCGACVARKAAGA